MKKKSVLATKFTPLKPLAVEDKDFAELKSLLEGARIVKLEPCGVYPEAGVAKFTTDAGNVFVLHSTELGFWVTRHNNFGPVKQ